MEEQQQVAEAPAQRGRQDDLFGSDSEDEGGQQGPEYDEDAGDEDFQPGAPAAPAATDLKTKLALLAQKKKKEAVCVSVRNHQGRLLYVIRSIKQRQSDVIPYKTKSEEPCCHSRRVKEKATEERQCFACMQCFAPAVPWHESTVP